MDDIPVEPVEDAVVTDRRQGNVAPEQRRDAADRLDEAFKW